MNGVQVLDGVHVASVTEKVINGQRIVSGEIFMYIDI